MMTKYKIQWIWAMDLSLLLRTWSCVLNWKQTALHTEWDQNLRDTSYKLVLFISSSLNTHKSMCYY